MSLDSDSKIDPTASRTVGESSPAITCVTKAEEEYVEPFHKAGLCESSVVDDPSDADTAPLAGPLMIVVFVPFVVAVVDEKDDKDADDADADDGEDAPAAALNRNLCDVRYLDLNSVGEGFHPREDRHNTRSNMVVPIVLAVIPIVVIQKESNRRQTAGIVMRNFPSVSTVDGDLDVDVDGHSDAFLLMSVRPSVRLAVCLAVYVQSFDSR